MHAYQSLLAKESAPVFRDKIREFNTLLSDELDDKDRYSALLAKATVTEKWTYEWLIENSNKRIKEYDKNIRRFTFYLNTCLGKAPKNQINIEQIKENTDPTFLLGKSKAATSKTLTFLCPFHNDTNPSFVWYRKTKSGYCFSCGKHGDIIDISMTIFNLDFKEACKKLS